MNTLIYILNKCFKLIALKYTIFKPCWPCGTCTSFAKGLNVYDVTWSTTSFQDECITPKVFITWNSSNWNSIKLR